MPNAATSLLHGLRRSTALLAAGLLLAGTAFAQDYAFAWNPRSGDAWVDTQLADITAYGSRYRGAFVDELVRYHAAPRDLVNELVSARHWAHRQEEQPSELLSLLCSMQTLFLYRRFPSSRPAPGNGIAGRRPGACGLRVLA